MDIVIIVLVSICIVLLVINIFVSRTKNNADIKLDGFVNLINSKNEALFDKVNMKNDEINKSLKDVSESINNTNKLIVDNLISINKSNSENYINLSKKMDEFTNLFLKDSNDANNKIKEQLSVEIKDFNKNVKESLKEFDNSIKERINEFNKTTLESFKRLEDTVSSNLKSIREDNNEKLEKINVTVGEKLEKTLEGRLKQSFDNVIEQIGGVNKAIGEIKGLASDVGSLKTVLTNVKTKGIVGEVILGNIIKDILTVEQYEENCVTKKNSSERVEFAIKMPGSNDEYIYLPIDSKLPLESYHKIKDGMDLGNSELIKEGRKELKNAIRKYAKDIKDKYIDVPNTTDFAIMFLPIEGLYVEVLNMGLFEELQREYKVNVAGPTTLTAILNALQMGFKTLIIQKKSADVFKLLGAVKSEFEKFADTLQKTQKKVGEASNELDKLVGTRTRMIQSKLRDIETLDVEESREILGIE